MEEHDLRERIARLEERITCLREELHKRDDAIILAREAVENAAQATVRTIRAVAIGLTLLLGILGTWIGAR